MKDINPGFCKDATNAYRTKHFIVRQYVGIQHDQEEKMWFLATIPTLPGPSSGIVSMSCTSVIVRIGKESGFLLRCTRECTLTN